MSTTWESVLTVPPSPEVDHIAGRPDAPLSLVEYGDYECPFCAMAHPVAEEIVDRLGDDLLFAFRHFPLSTIHPHAAIAAEAAEAAASQDRFWEMHGLLFANHRQLEAEDLVARAEILHLDLGRFIDEIRTHAHRSKVQSDFLSGVHSGVNGTPTFFINGRRHDGPADLPSLMGSLQAALQQS
jgi:protein-disulfide isomerase